MELLYFYEIAYFYRKRWRDWGRTKITDLYPRGTPNIWYVFLSISIFKIFKNNLYKSVSINEYFGVRFEINIAASLIRKRINFSKTESPDFTIQMGTKDIYIECGSSHLARPKSVDLKYKIGSIIREKATKVYCNSDTALFIDATNIFNNTPKDILLTAAQFKIRTFIKGTVDSTKFGNVTVFSYIWNKDLNAFQSNYHRIDNEHISKPLKQFLDQFYPIRGFTVLNFEVPSHGWIYWEAEENNAENLLIIHDKRLASLYTKN